MGRQAWTLVLVVACTIPDQAVETTSTPSPTTATSAVPVTEYLTTTTTTAVPVTTPITTTTTAPYAGLDLGPALDPDRLLDLPDEGIAVDLRGAVVLVDFAGKVLGHLEGFALDYRINAPGPVSLYDESGGWVLDPPDLYRSQVAPLAFGGGLRMAPLLARSAQTSVVREGVELATRTRDIGLVSADRQIVTFGWPGGSAEPPVMVDLADGRMTSLPHFCGAGARAADGLYLVCADFGQTIEHAPTVERIDNSGH